MIRSSLSRLRANFDAVLMVITLIAVVVIVLALAPFAVAQKNDGGLKTIDNPGGGQVVYGSLTNVTSMGEAMGAMLRNVHGHFGEKPQIDKFFRTKGSDSVATFFHLTAKNQGNRPVAGMVIVFTRSGSEGGRRGGAV